MSQIKKTIEITMPSELDNVVTLETLVDMFNKGAKGHELALWSDDGLVCQLFEISVEPVYGESSQGLLVKTDGLGKFCDCLRGHPYNCVVHRPIKGDDNG